MGLPDAVDLENSPTTCAPSARSEAFTGLLYLHPPSPADDTRAGEPSYFHDLNLDRVVDVMTGGRKEYDLKPYFRLPLHDEEEVEYRQHVFADLEKAPVAEEVRAFAERMRAMRKLLRQADELHHLYQQKRLFVDATEKYCAAVEALTAGLDRTDARSRGFRTLRAWLAAYTASDGFTRLVSGAAEVDRALADVRYSIRIKGNRVRVTPYEGEPDYSREVERTFAKFQQDESDDHRSAFRGQLDMNHVEAQVLDLVAKLNPDAFATLDAYVGEHSAFLDDRIRATDRELQFYLAYLDFIAPLKSAGLAFCHPRVSTRDKAVRARDAFDLALADKLVGDGRTVVTNGFRLTPPERVIVVTGPNQGGKTTFARMFGQLHHLAALGCPVPAAEAELFLLDRMFTHFEREEDLRNLRGKLEDELTRIHQVLQQATGDSVIVMNESFNSTTLHDALFIGEAVLRQIIERDLLCVYVTFVDELAALGAATVSMVPTVESDAPATRTHHLVRQPADGLAYATAIAEKYRLTYGSLRRRLAP
ncbi:hypothetical protein [Streptomyces sp. NPDC059398]|uniref:MutS-related protein n=1 Tax=Streptomyces sp. NPDC059398 TaxID=3346820 RepID=UPI0036CA19CC